MKNLVIFEPKDAVSSFRGGGRIMQILHENFPEAQFVTELTESTEYTDSTLLVPVWNPFTPPILTKRIAKKQILMLFDVIPLKYSSHFPTGIRGNFNLWRNKGMLSIYDKIITISDHSKKDIVHYLNVPANKIEVVYPAVSKLFQSVATSNIQSKSVKTDPTESTESTEIPGHFALYVGDVNWNKNLVNLAKAIKIADIPCVFVGKPFSKENVSSFKFQVSRHHPWLNELKSFLEEVGDDKRFMFDGYVPDDELITLYQKAVCNVLVSRDEGFGYSFAEAASQKCPSVLSDIPVFHETAGDSALFADPDSPQAFAEKINLFSDKKSRSEYGKKAYGRAVKKYSGSEFRKKLGTILNAW